MLLVKSQIESQLRMPSRLVGLSPPMINLHRPCPICGSAVAHLLHHQCFALPADHPLPRAVNIVACPTCDFVFADTEADAAAYDRYYSDYSKYSDQGTSTGGGGNACDNARIQVTAAEIARHLPDLSSRIVDIGCANGGILGALHSMGYSNLLGVDPSPECVSNTQKLFQIPAMQGWLGAPPPEAGGSDLIILSHVLEHVLMLGESLVQARALLSPGGMLYVEVPDAARYSECFAAPFQDFNTEHINHFCVASLANLCAAHGFEPVAEGTKTLDIPGGAFYPACYGFFRLAETAPADQPVWRRAPEFLEVMKRYVTESSERLHQIETKLDSVLSQSVIVWGVGQFTLKLLVETGLKNAEIVAFVDGNPMHHGKMLYDRPILAPEALPNLPPHPIVIGSLLHHVAIADRISCEMALPNPIVTLA